jgi:hypothetical protein
LDDKINGKPEVLKVLKTLEAEVEDDVAEVGKELNQNDSKATLSLRKNTKFEVE